MKTNEERETLKHADIHTQMRATHESEYSSQLIRKMGDEMIFRDKGEKRSFAFLSPPQMINEAPCACEEETRRQRRPLTQPLIIKRRTTRKTP
jgi:hypothetical protein